MLTRMKSGIRAGIPRMTKPSRRRRKRMLVLVVSASASVLALLGLLAVIGRSSPHANVRLEATASTMRVVGNSAFPQFRLRASGIGQLRMPPPAQMRIAEESSAPFDLIVHDWNQQAIAIDGAVAVEIYPVVGETGAVPPLEIALDWPGAAGEVNMELTPKEPTDEFEILGPKPIDDSAGVLVIRGDLGSGSLKLAGSPGGGGLTLTVRPTERDGSLGVSYRTFGVTEETHLGGVRGLSFDLALEDTPVLAFNGQYFDPDRQYLFSSASGEESDWSISGPEPWAAVKSVAISDIVDGTLVVGSERSGLQPTETITAYGSHARLAFPVRVARSGVDVGVYGRFSDIRVGEESVFPSPLSRLMDSSLQIGAAIGQLLLFLAGLAGFMVNLKKLRREGPDSGD